MNLTDIIQNPWFGLGIGVLSIIIGIATSHYYYLKGKKEGEASSNEYKNQLIAANKRILQLQEELKVSNLTTSTILKKSFEHDLETSDIKEILQANKNYDQNELEILNHFDLLLNQDKIREAKNFYNGAKEKIKSVNIDNYINARIKTFDGNFNEAIQQFNLCLIDETNIENRITIHRLISNIYFINLSAPQLALKELISAYNLDKSKTPLLVNIAACYMELEEYELAEEQLNAAIKSDPEYPDSYYELAQLYNHKNDPENAVTNCKVALELGAINEMVYRIMGDSYSKMENYDEALMYYGKALEMCFHPEIKREIMIAEIITYQLKGDLVSAENVCNTCFKNYPDDLRFLGIYFDILNDLGNSDRVLKIGLKLKLNVLDYNTSVINYNIGRALLSIKEYESAREMFELVFSHNPLNTGNLHYLAEYNRKKPNPDFNKALEFYIKINEITGDTPDTLNWIGVVLMDLKEYDQAVIYFNKALSIEPSHKFAIQNRSLAKNLRLSTSNKFY